MTIIPFDSISPTRLPTGPLGKFQSSRRAFVASRIEESSWLTSRATSGSDTDGKRTYCSKVSDTSSVISDQAQADERTALEVARRLLKWVPSKPLDDTGRREKLKKSELTPVAIDSLAKVAAVGLVRPVSYWEIDECVTPALSASSLIVNPAWNLASLNRLPANADKLLIDIFLFSIDEAEVEDGYRLTVVCRNWDFGAIELLQGSGIS